MVLLQAQEWRQLSPLEDEAVTLVFEREPPSGVDRTIIVQDILLRIVDDIDRLTKPWLLKVPSTYDGDGRITINRSAFPHTGALNMTSSRGNIEEFLPGNMHYLSTLIFECAHHWQEKYNLYRDPGLPGDPPHHFNKKQLESLDLFSEQHASAAQIYFLLAWQLRYRRSPRFGGPYLDLTSQPSDSSKNVGPTNRYTRIFDDFLQKGKPTVDLQEAKSLDSDFVKYRRNLWDRGETTRCKEATQEAVIGGAFGQFLYPIVEGIPGGSRPCKEENGLVSRR